MPDFQMPDVGALAQKLNSTPLSLPQSDKGRFFNSQWWPNHYSEIEEPVLKAISREEDSSFNRRVDILRIAERVDAKNGGQLEEMGFKSDEITRYVTRALNKRLRQLTSDGKACFVIRNQRLQRLALEHKAT